MANIAKLAMSDIVRLQRDLGLEIYGPYGTRHAYDEEQRQGARRGHRRLSVGKYAGAAVANDDLMGTAEIAAMLGITRQWINQLVVRNEFPEPVAELTAGRIWKRADVEKWARTTGRIS